MNLNYHNPAQAILEAHYPNASPHVRAILDRVFAWHREQQVIADRVAKHEAHPDRALENRVRALSQAEHSPAEIYANMAEERAAQVIH